MDEKELINKAQNGCEESFTKLLSIHLPFFKQRLFSQYNIPSTDADDIIQIASEKVWRKIKNFRQDSSFNTWLFVIIRNEALNFIKSRNKIQHHEVSTLHFSQEDHNNDYEYISLGADAILEETAEKILSKKEDLRELRGIIDIVLNKLKPEHSTIIRLALEEELSYREISEKLKIPIGTVMSRLHFARNNAKKLILENYGQLV